MENIATLPIELKILLGFLGFVLFVIVFAYILWLTSPVENGKHVPPFLYDCYHQKEDGNICDGVHDHNSFINK